MIFLCISIITISRITKLVTTLGMPRKSSILQNFFNGLWFLGNSIHHQHQQTMPFFNLKINSRK